MRRQLTFTACCIASVLFGLAQAEITYTVKSIGDGSKLSVAIEFTADKDELALQMPNWAPGSYVYADNWRRVENFTLQGGKLGQKPNNYTWPISTRKGTNLRIAYEVPTQFAENIGHFSGPSTYMYLVGRKEEGCKLVFAFDKKTPIAVGLDPIEEHKSYKADDYDVLADNPVTYGDFVLDTYKYGGKTHYIAYRGPARKDVDYAYVRKACNFVTWSQGDFFGGLPYNRYVWHFQTNDRLDGAGGLEHLSSTQITLSSGVGPRAVSVLSHEFFHLWNVKRIRSAVLGPFDYTTLPKTGALWWLEGVTDYYAHTLMSRYGWWNSADLYEDALRNVTSVRRRPERFDVSPYESSYRVADANNGRGNSQGFGVSYYNTGWVVGMILDIALLDATDGKHSLDDVEKTLWQLCENNQPGFDEGEIRNQCAKFGGLEVAYLYDKIVMKPGELPVEEHLAKLGLQIVDVKESRPDFGFRALPDLQAKQMRVSVATEVKDSPLKSGDFVVSVGGKKVEGTTNVTLSRAWEAATKDLKVGDRLTLKVKRGSEELDVTVPVSAQIVDVKKIVDLPNVSARAKFLRAKFEARKR